MEQERETYASRKATYSLNPAQVFDVVTDLETYLHFAKTQAMKDNPDLLRPSAGLRGNGRTLALSAEVVNEPGFLTSFDLAKLVLSEDSKKLTLATHEHPRVTIPSEDVHYIAERYQIK